MPATHVFGPLTETAKIPDGMYLYLETWHGAEYRVQVVSHPVLSCDLVVIWLDGRPDLGHGDMSTVCVKQLRAIRRA